MPLGGALLVGRRVLPGQYDVRLYAGEEEHAQSLRVVMDPRSDATDADLRAQDMLMQAIDRELTEINSAAADIRSVRFQVESLVARGAGQAGIEELKSVAEVFRDSLTRVEGELIQTRATASVQTVINFPNRLNYHYVQLRLQVDNAAGAPTEGQQTRFADLSRQWAGHQVAVQRVLADDLDRFNELVRRLGLPAIVGGGMRRDIS